MEETATSNALASRRVADAPSFKQRLMRQFAHPRGLLGRLAGFIMSRRPSNRERNRWTVEQLELSPTHRVLEIGVGPGLALSQVARRIPEGFIAGCDHSELMVKKAAGRLRREQKDRVRLVQGSVEEVVSGAVDVGGPFDRIFGVNVAMFFVDPVGVYRGLAGLLVPGGRLQITHQPPVGDTSAAAARRTAERIAAAFQGAGLVDIELRELGTLTPPAYCVIGTRRGAKEPPLTSRDTPRSAC